jgi:nitrous oxidase accessory protein
MKYLLTIVIFFTVLKAECRVLTVGIHQQYPTIRTAVNAAQPGDTVVVKKALYYINNIIITKSITILGEDYPVLHGANKFEIFTISGNRISIKGFHFKNSGYSAMNDFAAIKIIDARNITIENNIIDNAYFGIHIANSEYFTIRNNTLSGLTRTEQTTGNGIHLWKCNNALIEKNNVTGHRDGIYFEFVTHSMIRDNHSQQNIRYGLHFMFSNDDQYIGNLFKNNGAGVAVMYSKAVTMLRNRFENNWGAAAYGILLKEINDSKIQGNLFYKNTVGIHLEGTNRIDVGNNEFKENGWAAKIQASCSENSFYHNNFFGNSFDIGTNGSLVLNQFNNNYWDKYEGYDLDKNGVGDVAYHPVSMYSTIIEENPNSLMLMRSFMVSLLDKAEKAIPSLTPENLVDQKPLMKAIKL